MTEGMVSHVLSLLVALTASMGGTAPAAPAEQPAPTTSPTTVQATTTTTVPSVSVKNYGAMGDGVTNDSAAIQRANNAVSAKGGGRVEFPPGTYITASVEQDSNVEFVGMDGATLKHPDGVSGSHIVSGRVFRTKGSVAAGSRQLKVTSTVGIKPSAIIGVRGAGGASKVQVSTLASSMTGTAASFVFTQPAAWAKDTTTHVLIDKEILSYASISDSSALNVKRGLFGTSPAQHVKGAVVSQLNGLIAVVNSISGSTVVLDRPATLSVSGVDVHTGSTKMSVRGLTLDGSRVPGGSTSNPFPLKYGFARWVRVEDNTIRNGDHGAVSFDQGTSDSTMTRNVMLDNGTPTEHLGAAVWLFRGASRNIVSDNEIGGASYSGIMVDDRSVSASEWDATVNDNQILRNRIDIPRVGINFGIYVAGGNRNKLADNEVRSTQTGISIIRSKQGLNPVDSQSNEIRGNRLHGHHRGLHITGSNNIFEGNLITGTTYPTVDTGVGNKYL
jgi:parallel beta-helix repeat protein